MARITVTIYKKSPLATVISVCCPIMVLTAISLAFEKMWLPAIIFLVIGIWFLFLAPAVNERKLFKLWVKNIQAKGLEAHIAQSLDAAITVYNTYPNKKTIDYIRSLNPQFAYYIQQRTLDKNP